MCQKFDNSKLKKQGSRADGFLPNEGHRYRSMGLIVKCIGSKNIQRYIFVGNRIAANTSKVK